MVYFLFNSSGLELPATIISFCSSCRSFKALFCTPREDRKQKSNAIVIKFYVIFFTNTSYIVHGQQKKDNVGFYHNIRFLLSFLTRYSKERFKRPAAVTKTDYSRNYIVTKQRSLSSYRFENYLDSYRSTRMLIVHLCPA